MTEDLTREIDVFFNDHQMFHTNFQIDNFIIGQSGTTWGRYKQVLRELTKRWEGLKQKHIELRRLAIEVKKKENDAATYTTDEVLKELAELDLMELNMKVESQQRAFKDSVREFNRFLAHARKLKSEIGELTEEKRDALDMAQWEYKAREHAAMDMISQHRLTEPTLRMLHSFPLEKQQELIAWVTDTPHDLCKWFERQTHYLPPPDEPDDTLPNMEQILQLTEE